MTAAVRGATENPELRGEEKVKESTAKSAVRVFEILELFELRQQPLALKDIVTALGFPTSSGEELLKSLCHRGYLCFDPLNRTYMPTPKVTRLGKWVPDALLMNGRLQTCANRLSEISGEMVAVAVANELVMQNIYFIPARRSADPRFCEDRVFPLVGSAMGVVWLADKNEERIERLYRLSIARKLVDRMQTPLKLLLGRVNEVRSCDVAIMESLAQTRAMMAAIPVPVPVAGRKVVLCVGGPADRFRARLDPIKRALDRERQWLLAA